MSAEECDDVDAETARDGCWGVGEGEGDDGDGAVGLSVDAAVDVDAGIDESFVDCAILENGSSPAWEPLK